MRLFRRLRHLLRRRRFEAELREEMDFHRSMLTGGRGTATPSFGNATLALEDVRSVWIAPWIGSVWQDIRIGARLLRRSPIVTIVAIATMALGIGANTAVYSLIDGAMFRTMPVPEPDRLVFCTELTKSGVSTRDFTRATFEQLHDGT